MSRSSALTAAKLSVIALLEGRAKELLRSSSYQETGEERADLVDQALAYNELRDRLCRLWRIAP